MDAAADEIPTIVAQFAGGFLRGHLDSGETPEQALQRYRRSAHGFRAEIPGSLKQPQPWHPRGPRGVAVGRSASMLRGCCVVAA